MKTEDATQTIEAPPRHTKYATEADGRVTLYESVSGRRIRVYPVDADELIALGQASLTPPAPKATGSAAPSGAAKPLPAI